MYKKAKNVGLLFIIKINNGALYILIEPLNYQPVSYTSFPSEI